MKDDWEIRIKNKQELLHALTNKEILGKILEQGAQASEVGENIKDYLREYLTSILDYFMKIKDQVNAEELRFYWSFAVDDNRKNKNSRNSIHATSGTKRGIVTSS